MIEMPERRLKNNLLANRSAPFLYHNADGAGCQGRRSRAACSLYTEFGMVSPLPVPCKRSSDARSIHIKSGGWDFHDDFPLKCFIALRGYFSDLWRGVSALACVAA